MTDATFHGDAPIVAQLVTLMTDGQPHAFEDLADRLVDLLPEDTDEAGELLFGVLDRCGRFMTWDDEEWFDLHAVLEGRCPTHRLTGLEAAIPVIPLQPDIDVALMTFDDEVPFADGTEGAVVFAEDLAGVAMLFDGSLQGGGLTGPEGWLADAEEYTLVGVWFGDGALMCRPAEPDATLTAAAVDALSHTFADLVEHDDDPVWMSELVVTWLIAQPDALRTPHEPLAVLLEAAGLEHRVDYVGRIGSGWMTPFERMRTMERVLNERCYGVDERGHTALNLVDRAFAGLAPEGTSRDVARALSYGQVAEAFVSKCVGYAGKDLERVAERLVGFAHELVVASRGAEAAGPLYVQSVGLECLGDVVEAEAAVRAALAANPAHRGAAEAMAAYLEDRGEAARALEHLHRAGIDDDDRQAERLMEVLSHGGPKVGRNEPCPCGSGRKFKVCCINHQTIPPEVEFRWLYEKALAFVLHPARRASPTHLAGHAVELEGSDESPGARVFGDRRFAELSLFDEGLLEQFIDEREAILPSDEVEIAKGWIGRPLALYDVLEARPGEGVSLRDTRSREISWVVELTASGDIVEGEQIIARILPTGDSLRLGGPIMRVSLRLRESAVALTGDPDADACDWAEWIGSAEAPPLLQNREGEATVMCSSRFGVPDTAVARQALAVVLERDEDGDQFVQTIEIDGERVIRGWVNVEGHEVVVTTNSIARRDRLTALVRDAIDGAVLIEEITRTPEEIRREAGDTGHVEALEPASPEAAEALAQYLADHARRWVDQEIPALGGMTPRQAVDDPTRREDLMAILRQFEQHEQADPVSTGDTPSSIVRAELGLS